MTFCVNIATVYCYIILLTVSKAEFRGQFPYLDILQDIGFIP